MRNLVIVLFVLGSIDVAFGQQTALPQPSDNRIQHLYRAAYELEAAGLADEAGRFYQKADDELRARSAWLETRQGEVDRLRQPPDSSTQVLVHVMMVELSRTKLEKLGFDFAKITDGRVQQSRADSGLVCEILPDAGQVLGVIEALRKDNLAKVLAEPTIVTVSGRPAYFHSGGEFPVPSPQRDGCVSIEYRKYGTEVQLLPTVLGDGRINLELRPQISEMDPARSLEVAGQKIPGLRVRQVETAVEIHSGQTLLLAGLVQTRPSRKKAVDATGKSPSQTGDAKPAKQGKEAKVAVEQTELLVLVKPEIVAAMATPKSPKAR